MQPQGPFSTGSRYFDTNKELAKEKSNLQSQLQRALQVNNALVKSNYVLQERLLQLSKKLKFLKEHLQLRNQHILSVLKELIQTDFEGCELETEPLVGKNISTPHTSK